MLQDLKKSLGKTPDPFQFNLYLSLENKALILKGNPYVNDQKFLTKLLAYFEAEQNFEACIEIHKRIKN